MTETSSLSCQSYPRLAKMARKQSVKDLDRLLESKEKGLPTLKRLPTGYAKIFKGPQVAIHHLHRRYFCCGRSFLAPFNKLLYVQVVSFGFDIYASIRFISDKTANSHIPRLLLGGGSVKDTLDPAFNPNIFMHFCHETKLQTFSDSHKTICFQGSAPNQSTIHIGA